MLKLKSRYGTASSASVGDMRAGLSTSISDIDNNPYGNTRATLFPKIKPQSQS